MIVRFLPAARDDLIAIYDYVADNAGPDTAMGYVGRIEQACYALATFPERGTRRDEWSPGVRTIGFERRATIVFRVRDGSVEIVRVLAAGRNVEAHLRDD